MPRRRRASSVDGTEKKEDPGSSMLVRVLWAFAAIVVAFGMTDTSGAAHWHVENLNTGGYSLGLFTGAVGIVSPSLAKAVGGGASAPNDGRGVAPKSDPNGNSHPSDLREKIAKVTENPFPEITHADTQTRTRTHPHTHSSHTCLPLSCRTKSMPNRSSPPNRISPPRRSTPPRRSAPLRRRSAPLMRRSAIALSRSAPLTRRSRYMPRHAPPPQLRQTLARRGESRLHSSRSQVQKELAEFDSKLNSKLVTIQDALPDEQHEQACYCAIASGRLPRAIVGRCPSDYASKQKKQIIMEVLSGGAARSNCAIASGRRAPEVLSGAARSYGASLHPFFASKRAEWTSRSFRPEATTAPRCAPTIYIYR